MCMCVHVCVHVYLHMYVLCIFCVHTYIRTYVCIISLCTHICTLSYSFVCVSVLLQPKEIPEILVSLSYKENERRLQGLVLKARHINLPSTSDSESEYSSFMYSTYAHTRVLYLCTYVNLYAYLLKYYVQMRSLYLALACI